MTLFVLLASGGKSIAQRVFINDPFSIYEMVGGPGSGQFRDVGNFGISPILVSIALHGDKLYVVDSYSELYQVDLNSYFTRDLGSLAVISNQSSITCMTCDKQGQVIAVDGASKQLVRFDPATGLRTNASISLSPDGDLCWYGDVLLYAANGAYLYVLDPDHPDVITPWMGTPGYNYFGLFVAPGDCKKSRLFGVSGAQDIVEIDPDTRTQIGVVCRTDFAVMDAASDLEDGTPGIMRIDSLVLAPSCLEKGDVTVIPSSPPGAVSTFTLDGFMQNTTGFFGNVANGAHTVVVTTSTGCRVDADFDLIKPQPLYGIEVIDPLGCTRKGSIAITPVDVSAVWQYSLNGGTEQTSPLFDQLDAGTDKLSMVYGKDCQKDSMVVLSNPHPPFFPATVAVLPTVCTSSIGGIVLTPVNNAPAFTAGLDNGTNRENLSFAGLGGGDHLLHVNTSDGCKYDSLITIVRLTNPEPEIAAAVKDQVCFTNNGSIRFSFSGNFGPYQTSLNQGSYAVDPGYSGLAPASYAVRVRDNNGCTWDSLVVVKSYEVTPVVVAVDSVAPVCTALNSGSLMVTIEGDQGPYQYVLNGEWHANGGITPGLSNGDYLIAIQNKDGCTIDTLSRHLDLVLLPSCANVYVPTAFSPDGNGVNDRLKVLHDPYLTEVHLQVYNRYGGVVFSSSDVNGGWDGSVQGVAQPAGTYVWKVAFVDHDKVRKTMQGTVLLIR